MSGEGRPCRKPWSFHLGPFWAQGWGVGDFMFRLFGRGLSVQFPAHPDGYVPLSERYGYRKAWHVAGGCVKPLPSASVTKGRADA